MKVTGSTSKSVFKTKRQTTDIRKGKIFNFIEKNFQIMQKRKLFDFLIKKIML